MIKEKKEIELLYAEFLKDSQLHDFQMLATNPNIFEVLRTQTYEIRHSNFLVWLLNPNGNHGLGDKFLRMFLYDLSLDERSEGISIFIVESLDYSNVKLFREWHNIDILIEFKNLVICIENKINHFETKGQLESYERILTERFGDKKHVYVYLNPYDNDPTHPKYIKYSYESLIQYIEQILAINKSVNIRTQIYLEDYINNLKNTIMDTGEKRKLANSIYYRHREILDFVINHKYDAFSQVKAAIIEKIRQKGWVEGTPSKPFIRFLTSDLQFIPKKQPDAVWKKGEAFLFEIHYKESSASYKIYCTVSPIKQPLKGVLEKALENVPNHKKEGSWTTYYNKTIETENNFEDNIIGEDYNNLLVEKIISEVEKMVTIVESKLIEAKAEIMNAAKI